jgi:hypothetical protein
MMGTGMAKHSCPVGGSEAGQPMNETQYLYARSHIQVHEWRYPGLIGGHETIAAAGNGR